MAGSVLVGLNILSLTKGPLRGSSNQFFLPWLQLTNDRMAWGPPRIYTLSESLRLLRIQYRYECAGLKQPSRPFSAQHCGFNWITHQAHNARAHNFRRSFPKTKSYKVHDHWHDHDDEKVRRLFAVPDRNLVIRANLWALYMGISVETFFEKGFSMFMAMCTSGWICTT